MTILLLGVIYLLFIVGLGYSKTEEEKIKVPSPMEIRSFEPQPSNLMVVTYANDRAFLFQIEKIIPRSDCNQLRVDEDNKIRLMTLAISQAHEYVLKPFPIMINEWVRYEN